MTSERKIRCVTCKRDLDYSEKDWMWLTELRIVAECGPCYHTATIINTAMLIPEWSGQCSGCKAIVIVRPEAITNGAARSFVIECPNCGSGDGVLLTLRPEPQEKP